MDNTSNNEKKAIAKRANCADALAVIQYKLKSIRKDSIAPRYQYLSLPELIQKVYEISGQLGVAITFDTRVAGPDLYEVMAIIKHIETGEMMSSSVFGVIRQADIPTSRDGKSTMNFMQWYGSCNTYLRRYALQNLLGLAADEDDDAGGTYRD